MLVYLPALPIPRKGGVSMSELLTAAQVLRRLADIELEGIQFYRGLADGTDSPAVRDLAERMLRAEQRHHDRFMKYAIAAEQKAALEGYGLTAPIPAEIKNLLDTKVFVTRERAQNASRYATDIQLFQVAIRTEEHTALLLTQLRPYVPRTQRAYIEQVIKEEWGHKDRLEIFLKKHIQKGDLKPGL